VKQCQRRLDRIVETGAKKGLCKPTVADVNYAKVRAASWQLHIVIDSIDSISSLSTVADNLFL